MNLNNIKINLICTKFYSSYLHLHIFSMTALFRHYIPIHAAEVPSFFDFPHLARVLIFSLLLSLTASISKICLHLSLSFHFVYFHSHCHQLLTIRNLKSLQQQPRMCYPLLFYHYPLPASVLLPEALLLCTVSKIIWKFPNKYSNSLFKLFHILFTFKSYNLISHYSSTRSSQLNNLRLPAALHTL